MMRGIDAMREVIDVLEEACFDEGRSRSAAATESARKARAAVDAKVEEWARAIAVLRATLEAVTAHAARCPVGYRVGEAGELLLWIPDDRPKRGLQLWLRELDELLGRPAYCDGDHAAPACADPQCWRGPGGAP